MRSSLSCPICFGGLSLTAKVEHQIDSKNCKTLTLWLVLDLGIHLLQKDGRYRESEEQVLKRKEIWRE